MRPNNASTTSFVTDGPVRSGARCCLVIDALLAPDECRAAIAGAEETGFRQSSLDYPATYRDNDRLVRDDPALARSLLERLGPRLPLLYRDAHGARWRRVGLNPRFRYCRYRDGQSFRIHRDGAYAPRPGVRSQLTVMLYLNDAASFTGGATRYWAGKSPESEFLGRVIPAAGRAVIFDHALWHDGEPVTAGTKYVLRTDVLYEREEDLLPSAPRPDGDATEGLVLSAELRGHEGYVWSIIQRVDGSLASGSRDGTIRLWPLPERTAGIAGHNERPSTVLRGHAASITAVAEDGDGRLWSGSRDRSVCLWEADQSRLLGRHEGAVLSLASLGSRGMASGGADGRILHWSTPDAAPVAHEGHDGWVWALAHLAPGLLASGSEDGTIRLWRLGSEGPPVCTLRVTSAIRALAVPADGVLAAGHEDGRISLWRLHDASGAAPELEPLASAQVHAGAVCALTGTADGRLASGGEDAQVRISSLVGLSSVAAGHHSDFVRGLALLRDGRLASCSYDGTLRIWEVRC